ncbi:MAG TPA: gliding motility-associated C-terminal domain-containing protein, partial [Bacteroidia bacterium]|nr:gliding motility-associated C-terminal domain-containing protein [Bacteroidia bacterium]
VTNAFSPNGDGHNDDINVQGICLETMTFMIFNRWGEKVFESTNQNEAWDGTFHGKDAETGVYMYRLEGKTYDGKGYEGKGNITLLR